MRTQKLVVATVWMAAACFAAEPDLTVAILAQAGTPGGGNGVQKPRANEPKREVLVRVLEANSVDPETLLWAEDTASDILAAAGIRLRWAKVQPTTDNESRPADCATSRWVQTIGLRFNVRTPADDKPGALAAASPFAQSGVRVTVFYDRVTRILPTQPEWSGRILGHVLAHEIGHMLLRNDTHTQKGLMKAQWTDDDFKIMREKNLSFTPPDANAIRLNLARTCSSVADTLIVGADNQ
jgi:hypothetical protein